MTSGTQSGRGGPGRPFLFRARREGARRVLVGLPALLLAFAPACSGPGPAGSRQAPTHPGAPVVLISIDTLRSDHLPAYGYSRVETPNLDALVRDSVLFERAFASCPLTLPSHVTLLTGLAPPTHGVRDNIGYTLDPKAHPTLAGRLRNVGYATGGAVSAWVLRGATGLADGFDSYDDTIEKPPGSQSASEAQRSGGATAARALALLDRAAGRPFFLFLHLYEPHTPYAPPEPFKSRYPLAYDGEIAAADAIVGSVLAELKKRNLYDRSIVVLLSDHGEGLGEHGEDEHGILLYREALQVPLLLKLPRSERGGARDRRLASLLDILPTLAHLVGLPGAEALPGADLLGPARPDAHVVAETFYPRIHLGWSDLHSLLDARYQFIEGARRELYDLVDDPAQRQDVFTAKGDVARAMKRALDKEAGSFSLPAPATSEEARKLASLGYLTGSTTTPGGPLPDPRESLPLLADMRRAFRLAFDGKDAEAVEVLRGILGKSPRMFDARYALAESLGRLGRYEEAAEAYKEALRISPALSGEIALALGRVLLRLDRYEEAEANAELAARVNPGEAHALGSRAALLRGDLDKALREADLAGADPNVAAESATLKAEVALRRNAVPDALVVLTTARERLVAEKREPVENLEFLRGDALGRLGRYPEAEAAFHAEITAFPGNVQAYSRLAVLLAVEHRTRTEVQALLEGMYAAKPAPATALLAATTLESIGDDAAARPWRQRAAKGSSDPGKRRTAQ